MIIAYFSIFSLKSPWRRHIEFHDVIPVDSIGSVISFLSSPDVVNQECIVIDDELIMETKRQFCGKNHETVKCLGGEGGRGGGGRRRVMPDSRDRQCKKCPINARGGQYFFYAHFKMADTIKWPILNDA